MRISNTGGASAIGSSRPAPQLSSCVPSLASDEACIVLGRKAHQVQTLKRLAQLVEHQAVTLADAGSNPAPQTPSRVFSSEQPSVRQLSGRLAYRTPGSLWPRRAFSRATDSAAQEPLRDIATLDSSSASTTQHPTEDGLAAHGPVLPFSTNSDASGGGVRLGSAKTLPRTDDGRTPCPVAIVRRALGCSSVAKRCRRLGSEDNHRGYRLRRT